MDLQTFRASLTAEQPPNGISLPLRALWYDGKGNWTKAHELSQEDPSPAGAWVHAYLHRKEGDDSNAAYWYRRAGRPVAQQSLESEWKDMVQSLLSATL